MKRSIFAVTAAAVALAAPASAFADENTGHDCSYAKTEEASQTAGPITVYAGIGGDAGLAGEGDAAAGACADELNVGNFDGGAVEAGAGEPDGGLGGYVIVDGSDENDDPSGQSDGYVGISNFETEPPKGSCDTPPGDGTNSGGCVGIDGVGEFDVPVPIACGNTSGPTWNNTSRDGCSIP